MFNNTPDETAFARLWLEREPAAGALAMVQPALLSYGLGGPPAPVLLDVTAIQVEFGATVTVDALLASSLGWV